MEKKLELLLSLLSDPVVACGEKIRPQYWGVLTGQDAILAGTAYFIVDMRNLQLTEPQKGEFFSFLKGDFGKNEYPLEPGQIIAEADKQLGPVTHKVIVPISDLYLKLDSMIKPKQAWDEKTAQYRSNKSSDPIDACRVVIAPGRYEQSDITIRFTFEDGRWVFKHPAVGTLYISPSSLVSEELIEDNLTYRCSVNEDNTLNVIEPFAKVKIGVLYSPNGFNPHVTPMSAVNEMTKTIHPNLIVGSNQVVPEDIPVVPVHLHARLLHDLLKILLVSGNTAEFHLTDNPNYPVVIYSRKENADLPDTRIIMSTLNPFFGAQIY